MVEESAVGPEHDATDELLAHGNALLRYALSRVGNRATAEDLVQETLVTAFTKIETFAGKSTMKTWLIGILRHKILDHYRWQKRHPGDQPNYEDTSSVEKQDTWFTSLGAWRSDPNQGLNALDGTPSQALEQRQLRETLQGCIDNLPKRLHQVYVLRELEGLDPDATCTAAGVSRGSVTVFLYRARQTLRDCMQKKWGQTL